MLTGCRERTCTSARGSTSSPRNRGTVRSGPGGRPPGPLSPRQLHGEAAAGKFRHDRLPVVALYRDHPVLHRSPGAAAALQVRRKVPERFPPERDSRYGGHRLSRAAFRLPADAGDPVSRGRRFRFSAAAFQRGPATRRADKPPLCGVDHHRIVPPSRHVVPFRTLTVADSVHSMKYSRESGDGERNPCRGDISKPGCPQGNPLHVHGVEFILEVRR